MEGALYAAGFRAGDLITGADGEDFDSVNAAWEFLRFIIWRLNYLRESPRGGPTKEYEFS